MDRAMSKVPLKGEKPVPIRLRESGGQAVGAD